MNDDDNKNKRPIYFYYIIIFVIVLLLNAFVFPRFLEQDIEEVGYSTFINMVDEGQIEDVHIEHNQIQFTSNEDDSVYVTANLNDEDLINRLVEADVHFGGEIITEMNPILAFLLTFIGPILIFVILGRLLARQMTKKMGGGNTMSFGKSKAKVYVEAQTGKTFKDVAGQDEAKEALNEIEDFLHDPKKYSSIGALLPKGALLVGPPGTGKTLLAQAVAGEAEVPFFSISGSEFVEMFVGMGAARVRDLFKQAAEKAPCIVFIDEIDAIGKSRDGSGLGGNDEREQTLNQLLTEMDGFDGSSGVVILAATNRPEVLDKALLRPGRFDRRIPVELPDLQGREAILKVHAKNIKLDKNIDYNAIARATAGASGAELANIINEGAILAVREGRQTVVQGDLEEAVETVIAGYQRKNKVIAMKDKLIIAYHEIGHAIVAAMQKDSAPVHKITIVPRTSGALGYTMQLDEEEQLLLSKEEALNKIATYAGGRAAEELIFDSITTGASNDIEMSTKIARAMVTRYGMSDEFGMMALETVNNPYLGGDSSLMVSADTAAKVDRVVQSIMDDSYQRAKKILEDNIDKLHLASKYLLEKETISGDEFMDILEGKELEVDDMEIDNK